MDFVHLHVHSHYSFGRATPRVADLVARAAELKMPALALTDNNSIAGLSEMLDACERHSVQPIIGAELDVLPLEHQQYRGRCHRLTLLVETELGYENLVRLLSQAHAAQGATPPHVSYQQLSQAARGLIFLTGSPRGELYHCLRSGHSDATRHYLDRLVNTVGPDNLFFEVIEYPHPRIRRVMDYIVELSEFLGIPAVATQNVHFLDPAQLPAYCCLVQHPHLLEPQWPPEREDMPTRHFASPAEMQRRFGYQPQLLANTLRIAERCRFRQPHRRPRVPVPDFGRGQDPPSVLWELIIRGATDRYGPLDETIKERLNQEYGELRGNQGQGIDLSEWMVFLHAIAQRLGAAGHCRGVGRGPLIRSVVAYALGVTDIDPLAQELPFRSPRRHRDQYPPCHFECSQQGMEKLLAELAEHYGPTAIAAIPRRVDWSRQKLYDRLCQWVGIAPEKIGRHKPLGVQAEDEAPGGDDAEEFEADQPPALLGYAEQTFSIPPWEGELEQPLSGNRRTSQLPLLAEEKLPLDYPLRKHGNLAQVVHALHPCPKGFEPERQHYAIARDGLDNIVPLLQPEGEPPTCLHVAPMLDRLLVPRIQFAAFASCNVLEYAQEAVRREENPAFNISDIPRQDEKSYKLLGHGLTNGIRPLDGITAKALLRAEKPRELNQIVEILARTQRSRGRSQEEEDRAARFERFAPDALLAYRCAYLKAHHPVAFMVAMFTHSAGSGAGGARFQILLREARKMGIEILPPHINISAYGFKAEGSQIRCGLMAVQGLGERAFREISEARKGTPFSSLEDFCRRTNAKVIRQNLIVNLIKCGAFDPYGPHRAQMLVDYERALRNARRQSNQGGDAQLQLFEPEMFEEPARASSQGDEREIPPPTEHEILRWEQEAIRFSLSFDQIQYYEELMRAMRAISPFDILPRLAGKETQVAGFIDHIEQDGPLAESSGMHVLDLEGSVVLIPPELNRQLARVRHANSPVLVEGRVECPDRGDCRLIASGIYLLEEIARKAALVKAVRLTVSGLDRQQLSGLRSILKLYKGQTRVRLHDPQTPERPRAPWWNLRGIEGARVYFCPSLLRKLRDLLGTHRIQLLDTKDRELRL